MIVSLVSGFGGIALGAVLLVVFLPRLDRYLDRRNERKS